MVGFEAFAWSQGAAITKVVNETIETIEGRAASQALVRVVNESQQITEQSEPVIFKNHVLNINERVKVVEMGYEESPEIALLPTSVRHGFNLHCPVCGYHVLVGGMTKKSDVEAIKLQHVLMHSDFDSQGDVTVENISHAAELAHVFVEQTTRQTTSSTTYTDISGASISSASFTAGKKYLIFATAQVDYSNIAALGYIQALHGTTAFADSEFAVEPNTTTMRYLYQWWTVWTAVSGEGIKLQFKAHSGANATGADLITITAIKLSDDLTENTDWHYNEVAASTTLALDTDSSTNNASITFTPGTASHKWLILSKSRIGPGFPSTASAYSRIKRSGEATATEPISQLEGEDGVDDRYVLTNMRIDTLGAASNTYQEASGSAQTVAGTRTHSGIFALDISKLRNVVTTFEYSETHEDIPTATDYGHNIETTSITPDLAGDIWILGMTITDWGATGLYGKVRMQVDDSDQPPGQTTKAYQLWDQMDTNDHQPIFFSTMENLSAAAHTIDLDGSVETTGTLRGTFGRAIMAVSMELPASGVALVKNVNETVEIPETVNIKAERSRVVNESVSINETVIAVLGRSKVSPSEIVDITESVNRVKGLVSVGTETVNINEAVNIAISRVRKSDESVEISELANRAMTVRRNIDETVSIGEAVNRAMARASTVNETVNISEGVNSALSRARSVAETVNVGEEIAVILGSIRNKSETIQIAEDAKYIVGVNRIIASDIQLRLSGGAANSSPNASLGGAISNNDVADNSINNLWDDVGPSEAESGESEYRCIYIRNGHGTHSMDATKLWISSNTPAGDEILIGLGTSSINGTEQTVANENTEPVGVTFEPHATKEDALSLGSIPPEQHIAVWIKRSVPTSTQIHVDNSYQLMISCLTNYG